MLSELKLTLLDEGDPQAFRVRAYETALHGLDAYAGDPSKLADVMAFNVHAQVAIPARDRARLERLCRYLCRPPIAQQRLEEHSSGKLRYTFKKPWKDGTARQRKEARLLMMTA